MVSLAAAEVLCPFYALAYVEFLPYLQSRLHLEPYAGAESSADTIVNARIDVGSDIVTRSIKNPNVRRRIFVREIGYREEQLSVFIDVIGDRCIHIKRAGYMVVIDRGPVSRRSRAT